MDSGFVLMSQLESDGFNGLWWLVLLVLVLVFVLVVAVALVFIVNKTRCFFLGVVVICDSSRPNFLALFRHVMGVCAMGGCDEM